MSTRLERHVYSALVALALWVAVVVALPAPAQAQAASTDGARGAGASPARGVVVDPGDTLWSISSEKLGPDAAPWRVARGVERIYALNREQIGPDPNLIFAGQRLSVPPALDGPPGPGSAASEPSASVGHQAGRQAKRETLGAPRRASKAAPLPDAARAAPVPMARPLAAEEPPRSPGESFVDEARAAVANATSAVVGLFPSEGYEGYTWRELLGAVLLAVSSVAVVLTIVLAFALVMGPERAKRALRGGWWREVRANERAYGAYGAYERASFDPFPDTSLDEGLENGTTGAHANGAHANGAYTNGNNVPVGMILAAERKRGRLRRRGRPPSPARRVRRHARRGLAHGAYSPGIRRLLRGASGHGSRRPASRVSAASRERFVAEAGRTEVGAQ